MEARITTRPTDRTQLRRFRALPAHIQADVVEQANELFISQEADYSLKSCWKIALDGADIRLRNQ